MKLLFPKSMLYRGTLKCKYNTKNKRVIIFNVQWKWLPKLDPRQEKKITLYLCCRFLVFFLQIWVNSSILKSYIFFFMSDSYKMKKTQAAFWSGTGQMELYNKKKVTIKRSVGWWNHVVYCKKRKKKVGTGPMNNKKKLVLQYFNRFLYIYKNNVN